jgi:hypothetical protein
VRLYGTASARDADASRVVGTDPVGAHGLLLELVTTSLTLDFPSAPPAPLVNLDGPQTTTIYYRITNNSGATAAITLTVYFSVLVP